MTIYKTLQSDKKDEKSPEEAAVVMEPLVNRHSWKQTYSELLL